MTKQIFIMLLFISTTFSATLKSSQISFNAKKENQKWSLNYKWKDIHGKTHSADFQLSSRIMRQEDKVLKILKPIEIAKYQSREINRYAKKHGGVRLKAVVFKKRGLAIGGDKAGKKKGLEIAKKAAIEYAEMHDYFFYKKDRYIPDHIKHVKKYSHLFTPLVKALGGPTKDSRDFAEKALAFVQAIPYEPRRSIYRQPISVLAKNRGDCDSKTALFLCIIKNAYPNMNVGIVYVKNHAFAAMEITPQKGDKTFRSNGKKWVALEPVGPRLYPLGKVSGRSRRKLSFGNFVLRSI